MKTQVEFIPEIDDPELVVLCVEKVLVIWFDEATRCAEEPDAKESIAGFTQGLRLQLARMLRDLNERRERLSWEEVARAAEEEYLNADRQTAPRSGTDST